MKALKGLLIIGLAVLSFNSFAQDKKKPTPEERAKKMSEKMKTELDLTDDQTKKIEAVNVETIKKKRALEEEIKALRAKVKAVKENQKTKYKEILTPEQFEKLQEMVKERREKHKGKGPKHGGHGKGPKID